MKAIILDHKNIGKFYCDNTPKTVIYLITYKSKKLYFSDYQKATIFSSRFCPLAKIEISK